MKTKKIKINKSFSILTILLLVFFSIGCSKNSDDEMASPIQLKTQTFEIIGINDCNTSLGKGSTIFLYIPYTAPAGTSLKKLHRKSKVSNGESNEDVTTVFVDENNIIEWATCFRFGSQTWVEFEIKMEAEDGTLSNPSTVRINKPSEAN